MAINRGITLTAALRQDNMIHALARDKEESHSFSLTELRPNQKLRWWSYLEGDLLGTDGRRV